MTAAVLYNSEYFFASGDNDSFYYQKNIFDKKNRLLSPAADMEVPPSSGKVSRHFHGLPRCSLFRILTDRFCHEPPSVIEVIMISEAYYGKTHYFMAAER